MMTTGFQQFIKHTMAMRELSHDEVINRYWTDIASIASHGFLPFQLQGAFIWKPEGDLIKHGEFELINGYHDPIGKHILANPVAQYRQSKGVYVINGKLCRRFNQRDANATKRDLEDSIGDIALLAGVFSCCLNTAMDWCPARYLRVRPWDVTMPEDNVSGNEDSVYHQFFPLPRFDVTGAPQIDSKTIESLLSLLTTLHGATHARFKRIILKTLNWYRSGMSQISPLNRILNVVQALDSLAADTYKYLPSSVKQKDGTRPVQDRICEILLDVKRTNCKEKVMKAYQELHTSGRDQCNALIRWLIDEEDTAENSTSKLKGFLNIRARIAHGTIHDSDPDDIESVRGQDWKIQEFVRGLLVRALAKAPALMKLLPKDM